MSRGPELRAQQSLLVAAGHGGAGSEQTAHTRREARRLQQLDVDGELLPETIRR